MSLTALAPNSQQVSAGTTSPVGTTPIDPTVPNIHYQLDTSGHVMGVFMWSIDSQQWYSQSMAGSNWSEGLVCGWQGPHKAKHLAPVPTEVSMPCTLTPRFSVASPSTSPIPFEINDISSGTPLLVAGGYFPAGAMHADAQACCLVDAMGVTVDSFLFAPTVSAPVAHFTLTPTGGHSAMPADGETFMAHFAQAY